jgi:[ribosomal protein S18]-alanine N-acetyltransferase
MSPAATELVPELFEEKDAAAVAEIERLCSPSPWTENQFRDEFRNPRSHFWTLRPSAGQAVAAFGGFWLVAGEGQVANIAVHPDHRRRGFGRRLLRTMQAAAKEMGAVRMTLEVRESNREARNLYESEGFRETHRRPAYYEGRVAAILMEKSLKHEI